MENIVWLLLPNQKVHFRHWNRSILLNFPPFSFYFCQANRTCSAEEQAKIDLINLQRVGPSVICHQALSYIARAHSKDQNDFYNSKSEGATLYTPSCNKHSWKLTKPCCYGPNHANPKCMWEALTRVTANDYGISHIYEVRICTFNNLKKLLFFSSRIPMVRM